MLAVASAQASLATRQGVSRRDLPRRPTLKGEAEPLKVCHRPDRSLDARVRAQQERPRNRETECRNDEVVYDDLRRLLGHETEVARVVPHGPPDPIHFQRCADVGNPAHPIGGSRDTPIDAELITHYANILLL